MYFIFSFLRIIRPNSSFMNKTGRCAPDVIVGGNGKVVLFDLVVSVPAQKLFLIGPHKKLWIVPATPPLQKDTVFFPKYFDAKASSCTYSCPQTEVFTQSCVVPAKSSMEFLNDPIENVNIAICDIPTSTMQSLARGEHINTSLVFSLFGGEQISIPDLRVCYIPPRTKVVPYISLCCIIRNEARYLVEWIEYSRMIGIEHFYLYDHGSDDNTLDILAPYVSAGIATWHNWSFPGYPQREAHSHCTHRYAHMTRWLGLIDVDEFLVPVKAETLAPILRHFAAEPVVLRLSAAMFGTSGHVERPPGLVIASYTRRNASTHWPHNPQHKVFFRPGDGYVYLPSIHAVDISAEVAQQVDLHEHDAYYNHYRTKSLAYDEIMGYESSEEDLKISLTINNWAKFYHRK